MAKIKIERYERGHQPNGGWYFTSYRFPVDLAQKIDRVAQKESKDQGQNVSFSTATFRLLEYALSVYGAVPGYKSDIAATVLKSASGTKKAAAGKKAAKAEKPAKADKKAGKKAAKKAAKGLQVKLPAKKKAKVALVEDDLEVEVPEVEAAETEEEVEIELAG